MVCLFNVDGKFAYCLKCRVKSNRYKPQKINSTTKRNLSQHLLSQHGVTAETDRVERDLSLNANANNEFSNQPGIKQAFANVFNDKVFNRVIQDFIISTDSSFRIVENPQLKALVAYLRPGTALAVGTTIRDRIMAQYQATKSQIKTILDNHGGKISFGLDIWTSPNQIQTMGITAHFVSDDWKLINMVLDCHPFPGVHYGIDIYRLFESILVEWNLQDRIATITLDNASNNDTFVENCIENISYFNAEMHIRCFAHILNLCSVIFLDEKDERINKLRSIIVELRLSPKKMSFLEQICVELGVKHLKPQLDVKTRWNSLYLLIIRALEIRLQLDTYCERFNTKVKISKSDWTFFEAVVEILKPFYDCTLSCNADKVETLPMIYSFFSGLLEHVRNEKKKFALVI